MKEEVLLKYFLGKSTAGEQAGLERWVAEDEANAQLFFEMERIWSLKDEMKFSDRELIGRAYDSLAGRIGLSAPKIVKMKRRTLPGWIKYAAAAVVAGLLAVNIVHYTGEKNRRHLLTNTIEVSPGQRAKVTMSDGSQVWLNAGSRLNYPAIFTGKQRRVELRGEGYFNVAGNEKLPFVVHTDLLDIKVLGTKFDVKSYPGEDFSVLLKEGRVEVSTTDRQNRITMNPKEKVRYSVTSGIVHTRNEDTELADSWIDGSLVFREAPLAEIMRTLERHFDISADIRDPQLAGELFTCRVAPDASLREVLDLLRTTRKLNYKIDNREVIISASPKNR